MAKIRIFLLTYRRPLLLQRALDSLRAQTFTDWICELHNDDPYDEAPTKLVAKINDSRITLHDHERNWGSIAAFNHAFAGGSEPFASILEDDNWWDPEFLESAYESLNACNEANVCWANMRLWRENDDGSWTDTKQTIWECDKINASLLLYWPQPLQLTDAIHSNGAMLYRTNQTHRAVVPLLTPFAIIEQVRERLIPGGWLLLPKPLGNFAITLTTARSSNVALWAQSQLLIAASMLETTNFTSAQIEGIWATLRRQKPPGTFVLFNVALTGIKSAQILRYARPSEWFRYIVGVIRHPAIFVKTLRFRADHRVLWATLVQESQLRNDEARVRGPTAYIVYSKKDASCS